MNPEEADAIEAFERLGLTSYEAKVFIALERLGSGTARDVARTTDVPRSQVYSVAENLEERGLIEVQQSSPIRYRTVGIEEARKTLRARFETEQERAFEYVESVRDESDGEEEREAVWTVRGRDRVDDRVVELAMNAEDRFVFGARLPELVGPEIERTLAERAAEGVDVVGFSSNEAVLEQFESIQGVSVLVPSDARQDDDRSGRFVSADDDGVLVSVVDDDGNETAIWSSGSLFASVFIQLAEAGANLEAHEAGEA